MDWTCNTHGGGEKCEQLKRTDNFGDTSVDGQIILKRILYVVCGHGLGTSDTVMNLRVPQISGNFLTL